MSESVFSPKALLQRHGLRPKRHFGQNFLADAQLAARIAELCTTPLGGTVVEIGAGLGALTRPLLARAGRVIAIERDRDLVPALRADLAAEIGSGHLELLEADAKQVRYDELLDSAADPRVIAGNLPYQLTGPLLERFAEYRTLVTRIVIMVQAEVADRIVAKAGSTSYGALSVFIQAQYRPRREFVVRRGAFYPQPGVDSAVVVLEPRIPALANETPTFRALVRAAFQQRRKTLRNAWSRLGIGDPAALAVQAARLGLDLGARGETLTVEQFADLARELDR